MPEKSITSLLSSRWPDYTDTELRDFETALKQHPPADVEQAILLHKSAKMFKPTLAELVKILFVMAQERTPAEKWASLRWNDGLTAIKELCETMRRRWNTPDMPDWEVLARYYAGCWNRACPRGPDGTRRQSEGYTAQFVGGLKRALNGLGLSPDRAAAYATPIVTCDSRAVFDACLAELREEMQTIAA